MDGNELKFEKMPPEERRQLQKEYYAEINSNARLLRWAGIFFLLPMLIALGFSAYYLLNAAFTLNLQSAMWGWSSAVLLCGFIAMALSFKSQNGFLRWLWKEKGHIVA